MVVRQTVIRQPSRQESGRKEVEYNCEAFDAAEQMYLAVSSYAPPCNVHTGPVLAIRRQ